MFAFKITIGEQILQHIWDDKITKEACDTFLMLFSKKNDTRLQLLENSLLSILQRDMTIDQYFHKVKSICQEISELDPKSATGEAQMKRIIIHGLQPECRSFVILYKDDPLNHHL